MIIVLDATTKKLQAVMGTAATTTNPDFTCHYADNTGSAFTEGSQDGALNGIANVDIVSAPGVSTRRVVKGISIYNADTVANDITLKYDNNGTDRVIAKFNLNPEDTWTMNGSYDSSGNLKQVVGVSQPGNVLQHVVQTYNPSAAQAMTTSYADISGSSYSFTPVSASSTIVYKYHFHLATDTATQSNIFHAKLIVDASEETESTTTLRAAENVAGGYGGSEMSYVHSLSSWGTSAKTIKLQGREYNNSLDVKLFETVVVDGAISALLKRATLEIVEVS